MSCSVMNRVSSFGCNKKRILMILPPRPMVDPLSPRRRSGERDRERGFMNSRMKPAPLPARAVREKTQGGCTVEVVEVDAIPLTQRGKQRLIVQHLDIERYLGAAMTSIKPAAHQQLDCLLPTTWDRS